MEETTYKNGNSVSQNFIRNNSQGTSQITFKGSEDLGGGLMASFLLENDFDAGKDATSNFGSKGGEQYLGLSGGFGSIKLGAANTPTLSAQAAATGFGTKIGSGFNFLTTGRVRNNNSVVYASPSFNGLMVTVAHAFKTSADTNPEKSTTTTTTDSNGDTTTTVTKTGAIAEAAAHTDIGLSYANGPLTAGYSQYKIAAVAGGSSTQQNSLYVTYDLGAAKLGFGSYSETSGTATDTKATNISVTVPMGNLSLIANTGTKDDTTAANKDRTITALGVKYMFSKNTSAYARLVSQKFENMTANTDVTAVKTTLVGLQTNF